MSGSFAPGGLARGAMMAGLSLIVLGAAGAALAQDRSGSSGPPLLIFYSPSLYSPSLGPQPAAQADAKPDQVEAVRTALQRLAARRGTAVLDLSPAPIPAPTAAAELSRGIEAFRAFDLERALGHLSTGLREAAATGAAGLSPSELSDLHIHRALVFSQRGDAARAWDDFIAAATVDPTRKLDPVRFAPSVVQTLSRAVKAVTEAPVARLSVAAKTGCRVTIDGYRATVGETRTLPHGPHYIRVACADHEPYGGRVLIQQSELRLQPVLRVYDPPGDGDLARMARERGSSDLIIARVLRSEALAPTLIVRRLDAAAGAERDRATVVLAQSAARAGQAATAAVERILAAREAARRAQATVARPSAPSESPARSQAWYRKPWVWGLAGAALTAVVLAPLAFDSSSPTGFEVRPGGDLPPGR